MEGRKWNGYIPAKRRRRKKKKKKDMDHGRPEVVGTKLYLPIRTCTWVATAGFGDLVSIKGPGEVTYLTYLGTVP